MLYNTRYKEDASFSERSQIMLMRFKNYEATLTIANARRSREQQKKTKNNAKTKHL